MELRQTEKITSIGDKKYRLKKIDVRSSCWLFAFLGGKSPTGFALAGLGQCSRQEFNDILDLVLNPVLIVDETPDNTFEIPILSGKGTIADVELASDSGKLMMLLSEAIMFNLEPFFVENGSKSQKQEK